MADTVYSAVVDSDAATVKAYIDSLAVVMKALSITALSPQKVLVVVIVT